MEVVLNTRTRLVHLIEDGAELQDGRMQLVCGAVAEPQNLTHYAEPRDEGKPCDHCNKHIKDTVKRWKAMVRLSSLAAGNWQKAVTR